MSDTWRDSLPEELRNKPLIANAPDLTHLLNNAIEMESHMGRSLTIPLPDAPADEWSMFHEKALKNSDKLVLMDNKDDIYTKLGKPGDKDGYKGDPDKDYSVDVDALKQTAFDLNLSQDQFYNLLNGSQSNLTKQLEDGKLKNDGERATLYDEWGATKANKLEAVDAMMDLFNFPDSVKESVKEGMPAEVLNAMSRMAESISGEKIQAAHDKSTGASMYTPSEANTLVTKTMEHEAFRDRMHPEHKQIMQQYFSYLDMAAGRKPKESYRV